MDESSTVHDINKRIWKSREVYVCNRRGQKGKPDDCEHYRWVCSRKHCTGSWTPQITIHTCKVKLQKSDHMHQIVSWPGLFRNLKRSVYKDQFCSDAGTVLLPRLLPGWEEKLYHMHLHMRGWLQMSSVFVRAFMFPLSQTVSGWEEKYVAGSYRWTGLCPDIYVSDFPDSGLTFTLVIHEAVTGSFVQNIMMWD